MSRPNILLIASDQQRTDSLNCYGSTFTHTHHFDRLASGGTLFNRAYCTNPLCTPPRTTIFFGLYESRHGAWNIGTNLYVAAGFDAFQPLEAKANMDIRKLCPKYGDRMAMFGNVDVMIMGSNDRAKIEEEIRSKLARVRRRGATSTTPTTRSRRW